ncbi:hypothetical protein DVS77_32125 [Mycolicibacterium moriokaense]|nr:hypothetical protein DVS77_32125 [Mycolicibacterium moriokaense]
MSSKDDIGAALDTIRAGRDKLLGLPLYSLTWSERMALLQQIDELGRELAAFDRRLIGRLITQAPPPQFGGASWAEVLSRRLRISRAEAERRLAAAVYSPDVDRPSA